MRFSVIIPTYNRAPILAKTLQALASLNYPKNEFEVLVVSDGSTPDTKVAVENFKKKEVLSILYFEQAHQGQAQARNLGIEKSGGEIILFLGDDTIPDKNLLNNHDKIHRVNPSTIVLGLVQWDEAVGINDFMRYIAPNGPQFHFGTIKNYKDAGWDHFYTSNISLPRSVIGNLRFDTRFSHVYAAFEDIDFGLSLARQGIKIFFSKEALVHHHHFYTPEAFNKRMVMVGRSFPIFCDKYKKNKLLYWRLKWQYAPFDFFPGQLALFKFFSKILAQSNLLKKINIRYSWYFNICYYYAMGMAEQSKKNNL